MPTIQIAMADDHQMIRDGIANFIHSTDSNLKVFIQANDGIELLELIAKAPMQPDVCLVDIRMPRMDGFKTVLQLKKSYPYIRCLALTIYDHSEYAILQMLHNGSLGYITKNCRPKELVKAIRTVYNNDFYFCEEVLKIFQKISRANIEEYTKNLLTPQEVELLRLSCTEMTCKEIADKMILSQRTIENNYQKLHDKLNIKTRQGLAMYAQYSGIGSFNGIMW